ncbi:cytochrome c oxidase copper chaperone [Neoconidiobolus thromboides FSU 785]|nr:cytochrome c oxidase copper chaperone [Neoconidiobolus thromboides FSU 785]
MDSKPVETSIKKDDTKLKPCCACPDTKKERDNCVFLNGEENCLDIINKHKKCMRDLGFNI